jgi:hypothetical protein
LLRESAEDREAEILRVPTRLKDASLGVGVVCFRESTLSKKPGIPCAGIPAANLVSLSSIHVKGFGCRPVER